MCRHVTGGADVAIHKPCVAWRSSCLVRRLMRNTTVMGSMRGAMAAGWLGLLVACPPKPPPADPASTLERCPDPYSCTDPNGTGVYTAEGGSAGIGPGHMMILRFRSDLGNNEASVIFDGRYAPPPRASPPFDAWSPVTGQVYSATFRGTSGTIVRERLLARSVTEQSPVA